jgi:hypothetical protein
MINIILLNVILLNVIPLYVILLYVIMLDVILLSVISLTESCPKSLEIGALWYHPGLFTKKKYRGLGGLGHSLLNNSFEQQVLISDKMTIISLGGLPEGPALTKHFTAVICGATTLSITTPCLTTLSILS